MAIKVGDIVLYDGVRARVMRIESNDDSERLEVLLAVPRSDKTIYLDELELVKPVSLPEFEQGDSVIVHDIPKHEKDNYGCYWAFVMNAIVEACKSGQKQTIDRVRNHPEEGSSVLIKGCWFQVYHLTKADDYDMI